jgi:hypothetical protein
MKECRTLKEWLESQGNPKHTISDGENGMKVIVVEDNRSPESGIVLYRFKEENYYGYKTFWISSGWCVRNEYLQAIEDYLDGESEFEDEDESSVTLTDEARVRK